MSPPTLEELARWENIERMDALEWQRRVRAREWPWDDEHYYRSFIAVGIGLPHKSHDGLAGAPDGVWCARCEADRALDVLIAMSESRLRHAERDFLAASVAVWREIDALTERLGIENYPGLDSSTELRQRERAAWERYRNLLDEPPRDFTRHDLDEGYDYDWKPEGEEG